MIGRVISHYKILEKLGGGGMGVVYKAQDARLKRFVALKFLPTELNHNPASRQRFSQEAQSASALDHPNICTIYDVDETDEGQLFIAMAFYSGTTLGRRLRGGPLAVEESKQIAGQVARGLAQAHKRGIVHRDIKPANLMITDDGLVKIVDFGIAKLLGGEELTRAGKMLGTTAYMSPEQARGETVDDRSDVWGLGVVLYQMLAGELPFKGGGDAAKIYSILHREAPKISKLRPDAADLDQVLARALARKPEERYQTMAEMIVDLGGEPEVASPARIVSIPGVPQTLQRSVVVLPFADLSPSQDQAYFCSGMAEELIDALTKVPGLRIAARMSAQQLSAGPAEMLELGRRLKVESVLSGSVRKHQDRIRISVQLVDVQDGFYLWSDRFDRELEDVFAVQEEIARRVTGSLELTLNAETGQRIVRGAGEDLEAYNLYLKGRYHCSKRTLGSLESGGRFFRQALELDPRYARAYAGLADCYALLGIYGASPPQETLAEAKEAAFSALRLDDSLADVHASLGCVRAVYDWDWPAAEREYLRALELDPTHAGTRHGYAVHCLTPLGRFKEASRELMMARENDPLSPVINTSLALPPFFARRYEEAIKLLEEALELEDGFAMAHYFLGQALTETGDFKGARKRLAKATELASGSAEMLAAQAHLESRAGHGDKASALLGELEERARERYVSPVLAAQIHADLGDGEAALDALDEAGRLRAADLIWVPLRPAFADLRQTPRFEKTLLQIGLGGGPLAPTLAEPALRRSRSRSLETPPTGQ